MKALLKSYGDVVGNAIDRVELKIELRKWKKRKKIFSAFWESQEISQTHFIEFAFESVVVEMIGDVLQLAVLVEIDNGVVSESIDDFAVV